MMYLCGLQNVQDAWVRVAGGALYPAAELAHTLACSPSWAQACEKTSAKVTVKLTVLFHAALQIKACKQG